MNAVEETSPKGIKLTNYRVIYDGLPPHVVFQMDEKSHTCLSLYPLLVASQQWLSA
jgi:hypothetical protein